MRAIGIEDIQGESALNAALAGMDIRTADDACLAIVDRFYADDVEISSDSTSRRLIGKARLKTALREILQPLHMFASVGGWLAPLQGMPIYADREREYHSAWSLGLMGLSGRQVTLRWSVRRIWRQGLVAHEHFYEDDPLGEALLAVEDLRVAVLSEPNGAAGARPRRL